MNTHSKIAKEQSEVDRQIDDNLKLVFDQLASAPVPDRFSDLLNKLRAADEGTSQKGDDTNGS
ncbi:hypothetical protein IU397_20350 [Actibacterium sp. 188UL27-1]|nr:NepR family anti-sigma factor [Actibacterium sp. 188UL27-1]MBM7069926.1 hypothetical protein [Actibacterium sp. 188UL27-1]